MTLTRPAALALAVFVGSVIASNVLVSTIGVIDLVPGPYTLAAPAAVLAVGFALVARDVVHEHGGALLAAAAVIIGAVLSIPFADPHVVVASVTAYTASELVDLGVFAALAPRSSWATAALASSAVGLVVDSLAFLLLAFGSLAFLPGQLIGKAAAVAATVAVRVAVTRRRAVA